MVVVTVTSDSNEISCPRTNGWFPSQLVAIHKRTPTVAIVHFLQLKTPPSPSIVEIETCVHRTR